MTKEYIYLRLTGPTASYRLPAAISGTQLALETPTYSAILGLLSYMTGREITPEDTRIGFSYQYMGDGLDLETIHRWKRSGSGNYSYEDTNIRKRQIHYQITLDLWLDNMELLPELKEPKRQVTFGRSQDLATIERIRVVNAHQIDKGKLFGTLLPVESQTDIPASGMFYNLAEYFNYKQGKTRRPQSIRLFLALGQQPQLVEIDNLWQADNQVFYLHSWQ